MTPSVLGPCSSLPLFLYSVRSNTECTRGFVSLNKMEEPPEDAFPWSSVLSNITHVTPEYEKPSGLDGRYLSLSPEH